MTIIISDEQFNSQMPAKQAYWFEQAAQTNEYLNNVSAMEVVLNPGDAIFIPIAWWHRAESLDVSISTTFINFNVPNRFSKGFDNR